MTMNTPASGSNVKTFGGVKVLDWSQLVAGPYCAKLLADLGAEVIKIEKPGLGDEARHRGPFVHGDQHPEKSLLFLYANTNKLGVTLDIESPQGRERFIELVRWADILIEDNPPPVLEAWKLAFKDLSLLNPKLVMTSITPFGQTGPYRDYKAYPFNIWHGGGMGYLSPMMAGVEEPLKPGGLFSECCCGLIAAVGTLHALYQQQATGVGQQVDVSKQEAILSLARVQVDRYPNEKAIQSRAGFGGPRKGPSIYDCQDGYVVGVPNQPHEWRAFIRMIAGENIAEFEKYMADDAQAKYWEEIGERAVEWMKTRTKEEIYHYGQAIGCPITPVMTAEDIVKSPQSSARQFFIEAEHPEAGILPYPNAAYNFSATPARIERTAPLLGQHNEEVFSRRLKSGEPQVSVAEPGGSRQSKQRPLEGIRIADFSWAWAGSHATELLAFMGAEVIKIESMTRVDFVRRLSFTTGQQFTSVNQSYVFNDINLNKKSIQLNLSQPRAIELAKKLVSISDVTAQNMRPGVIERLGLGYEVLREIKPDIIYLSSSARGGVGPERSYSGYAPNFAAVGGILHITGMPGKRPGVMTGEIDLLSAITSTFAVLAALNHRIRTGEGQHIDLSSAESISVLIGDVLMDYLANGFVPTRRGNLDDYMAPHNCYRCKGEDKWVSIAVATDEEWAALCQVMGNPDWAKAERFLTATARRGNQPEMDRMIGQWTINYRHHEVMEMLQAAGVAAMPCFDAGELFENPHLQQRQNWAKVVHPELGEQFVLGPPWKLSVTPAKITSASPLMGEHSHYVFKELLGLSDGEIKRLEEEQVIY